MVNSALQTPPVRRFRALHGAILVVVAGSTMVGCSDGRPERVPVSGVVRIDGQPLTSGSVVFNPEKGRRAVGELDGDGRFKLGTFDTGDGCIPGKFAVTVHSTEDLPGNKVRYNTPKKYENPATSGLSQTIDGATSDLAIELKWDDGHTAPFVEQLNGGE